MIDAGEWLASRVPAPPAELAERLSRIVVGRHCADFAELSQMLVGEGCSVMNSLSDDRSGAFDLLVADALITYGLEAAAEDCSRLEEIARASADRITAVAVREQAG